MPRMDFKTKLVEVYGHDDEGVRYRLFRTLVNNQDQLDEIMEVGTRLDLSINISSFTPVNEAIKKLKGLIP